MTPKVVSFFGLTPQNIKIAGFPSKPQHKVQQRRTDPIRDPWVDLRVPVLQWFTAKPKERPSFCPPNKDTPTLLNTHGKMSTSNYVNPFHLR